MVRKLVLISLVIALLSIVLVVFIISEIVVSREMKPEWVYEDGSDFSRIAISADGEVCGAGAFNASVFCVFRGNMSLWSYDVGNVHSIAVSSDGERVAVAAGTDLYMFDIEISSPLLSYHVGYETSLVVISADGKYVAVGAGPSLHQANAESKLFMFEWGAASPKWTKTLPGVLESLSISDDGAYIAASTSLPGVMHVFAGEQEAPLWNYSFGDFGGGVRISGDGDYILAAGGSEDDFSLFQFVQESESRHYQKLILELPNHQGLSASSNGSIFAIGYTDRNELVLFDMNIRPYGPSSIRTVSLPAGRVSMCMSSDGRYVFVGTSEGVFVYEYLNNELNLKKQYTRGSPVICEVASSADGRHLVAVGDQGCSGEEHSSVYFFDIFRETTGRGNLWFQYSLLIAVIVAAVTGTISFVLLKKR